MVPNVQLFYALLHECYKVEVWLVGVRAVFQMVHLLITHSSPLDLVVRVQFSLNCSERRLTDEIELLFMTAICFHLNCWQVALFASLAMQTNILCKSKQIKLQYCII